MKQRSKIGLLAIMGLLLVLGEVLVGQLANRDTPLFSCIFLLLIILSYILVLVYVWITHRH